MGAAEFCTDYHFTSSGVSVQKHLLYTVLTSSAGKETNGTGSENKHVDRNGERQMIRNDHRGGADAVNYHVPGELDLFARAFRCLEFDLEWPASRGVQPPQQGAPVD